MDCRAPCIENQGVEVEGHWVARGCSCDRRNLDDFSNGGYVCLSVGYLMDVG